MHGNTKPMLFNKVIILYLCACVYIYLNVVCITAAPEGSSWVSEVAALPAKTAKRGSYITNSSPNFHPNQHFCSKIHVVPGKRPGGKFPNPKL